MALSRYRANFIAGTASGVIASSGQLTITGSNFPTNIPTGSYMPIILNPGYYGQTVNPEIIYIGSTTTSGLAQVVSRAQEGSTLTSGTNVPWVAGPTIFDFDATNLTSTGIVTLNNGLIVNGVATGTSASIYAPSGGLSVASGIYSNSSSINNAFNTPGGATFGGNLTVSGTATVNSGITIGVANNLNFSTGGGYQLVVSGSTPGTIIIPGPGTGSTDTVATLNGTQTLSNKTLGNTTVLGNLSINGGITFTSLSTSTPGITGIPTARVYAAAGTTLTGTGSKQVPLSNNTDNYSWATYGMSTTANANAITVPLTGYYQINASLGFSNAGSDPASGVYGLQIVYNGSRGTWLTQANSYLTNATGYVPETIVLSDLVSLSAGTYIYMVGLNGTSGSIQFGGSVPNGSNNAQNYTYLTVTYVGS